MAAKRSASEVAASDQTSTPLPLPHHTTPADPSREPALTSVTSNDIPQMVETISHTHLKLNPAGKYTWVRGAFDVAALGTRDRNDTQSLVYICAVNDLCRKYSYLPRPAELPSTREVCGIRKRLQPGAKLCVGANRCSNCIKRTRNTKYEWIGCWKDGNRCAACSMAKAAYCKFPPGAVDDTAAIPVCSVSRDGPPDAKRARVVLKIPVQAKSEPTEAAAEPENEVVGLTPKKGWAAVRMVGNLFRRIFGPAAVGTKDATAPGRRPACEDHNAPDQTSVAPSSSNNKLEDPASSENGQATPTKMEEDNGAFAPAAAIIVEEGEPPLGIRLAVEWDRVYRPLKEVVCGGGGTSALLFKEATIFEATVYDMARSQTDDPELAVEVCLILHQWDRVHHYLKHVVRLKDPEMIAMCLEDAAQVEECVKKIVVAVTSV